MTVSLNYEKKDQERERERCNDRALVTPVNPGRRKGHANRWKRQRRAHAEITAETSVNLRFYGTNGARVTKAY